MASGDTNEKKGAIYAIISLVRVDTRIISSKISRFANYLRNLLLSPDPTVMELAAKAICYVASASGSYTQEFVDFELKKAFEWLAEDGYENRRLNAVRTFYTLKKGAKALFYMFIVDRIRKRKKKSTGL